MNIKSILVCLLLAAIFLGCALANEEQVRASTTVSLHVFGSSSVWWVAVQVQNDNKQTAKVELKDSKMASYLALTANSDWGYWSVNAVDGSGFSGPVTFRLTSTSGATISVQMASIVPDALIDSGSSYGSSAAPSTSAPTTKPTSAPPATSAPTSAPTTKPTSAPTTRPTTAPTTRPTTAPPTAAPTTRPTTVPSTAPTTRPTSAPSLAPTTRPSSAPTTAPTSAPTTKPTTAPTTKPTTAPSSAPTTAPSTNLCAATATSSEPVKILVPLYVYPGAAWDVLIASASKVKIIAVINPNNGPVSSVDSSYSSYMTKLKNAGIDIVGYVYTGYGTRDASVVMADIDTYATKYPLVTGIFFDEGANDASELPYYTQLYNHVKTKSGYVHSILNPGVVPDQGYVAISSNIVIYENYATSLTSASYSSWVQCAPTSAQKAGYKYHFSGIVHTAAASIQASVVSTLVSKGMGLVYVTDGAGGCCTYNSLTTYFAQLADAVAAVNKA